MDKFSDSCGCPEDSLYKEYKALIYPYRKRFAGEEYDIISLPNGDIGIKAKIVVDAGSDSLLYNREPIVVGLNPISLEHSKPYIFPDRTDFPFDYFPHINVPTQNLPPTLCLTREDFVEWYSEHTFDDYLKLIKEWFNDATKGNLIKLKDGDYYESFRPHNPTNYFFRVPFEDDLIEKCEVRNTLFFSLKYIDEKCESLFYGDILKQNFEGCDALGMLFVKPANEVCKKWFVQYPQTIEELICFIVSNGYNWDIKELAKKIQSHKTKPKKLVFQFAFNRPTKVLGKHTCVDFLTFTIATIDLLNQNNSGKVEEVQVIDTLVPSFSNYLSSTKDTLAQKRILILGCGAVGSKLIYHFVRSGICNLTICDNDILYPHNICRHAVVSCGFFSKKVDRIANELNSMYPRYNLPIRKVDADILDWLPSEDFHNYDLIIDATASASVMRCLDSLRLKIDIPIIQFALSEGGKIGHLYINKDKSTLNSDFYMILVREAIHNDDLSNWLINEKRYSLDYVRVGEGCHSNTMILGDDIVSTHVALASQSLRHIDELDSNQALFSFLDDSYPVDIFYDRFNIDSVISIKCENAIGWEVRIPRSLLENLRHYTKKAYPKEAGGYLMGCVEEKYKRIYILHTYVPKKSYQNKSSIRLSTVGWVEEHKRVNERTANNLVYIGDWHSHPIGSLERSHRDILTSYKITANEIESKYGVCLITNDKETKAYLLHPNVEIIQKGCQISIIKLI